MHEMGIVFELLDTLKGVMKENNIQKINKVKLSVGEASMVVPDYLSSCWEVASQEEKAFKECKLEIVIEKALGECLNCHNHFPIKENDRKCPKCGMFDQFKTIKGTELEILEVEAD